MDWGFILFACSLPWSNFGISISYFLMLAGLLLIPGKGPGFGLKNNAEGISLIGVFLIFLIPLVYTQHLNEGLHDLNIKLPCLMTGLLLFFKKDVIKKLPYNKNYILLFSIACLLSVAFSLSYFAYLSSEGILDSRKASPFISHIRLSLMASIAFCFFLAKFFSGTFRKFIFLASALFIFFSVIYLGWVNGIIGLGIGLLVFGLHQFFKAGQKKWVYFSLFLVPVLLLIFFEYFRLAPLFREVERPQNLPAFTLNNRPYFHDTLLHFSENGNKYGLYYQAEELEAQWKKRSKKSLEEIDARGNQIKFTCFRYLTSKGLPKDSSGVWQLSEEDINNIEKGIPNYYLVNLIPFEIRLYELYIEMQSAKSALSVEGHSMGLRTLYWKTGMELIKENIWLGLGTGNVPSAIQNYYETNLSHLDPKFRNRSHNQYITTFLNSGLFGFLFFLFFLLIPLAFKRPLTPYYLAGWLIVIYSMIGEDTLETQAGVGLFIWVFLQGCFQDPSTALQRKNQNIDLQQFPS